MSNDLPKGSLISRTIIGKWEKVHEWNDIPLPGRGMPRGGRSAKLMYGCLWQHLGCQSISVYSVPTLHSANFRCGINECLKREWEETKYKVIDVTRSKREDVSCLVGSSTKVTYGTVKGSCRPPK